MEIKDPLISIICAIRNDSRFIRETLETIVSQSYTNWELIIMDAVSTDGTVEIVKEYAARHKNIIFRSVPDKGQWDALDKALAQANGEYLMVMCGQDGYLDRDWFKRCAETFRGHPEVSLVWGIPFNMSEESKLTGPHYAYASFLKDDRYGSNTKPISTLVAKIDWYRPAALERLGSLFRKLTWSRIVMVLHSFKKEEIPEKEDWFFYWLKTARAFPEGNMCVRKEVYIKNTVRFPKETMTNAALLDFCFNFNAGGYLCYGLPVAAGFGRSHAEGQKLREYDAIVVARYRKRVAEFRRALDQQKKFTFIDPAGKAVSEREIKASSQF